MYIIIKYLISTILILINLDSMSMNLNTVEKNNNCIIAIVDMQYILQHSLAVKDLKSKIDLMTKNIHDEMSQKELILKKEEDNLIKTTNKLNQNDQGSNDFYKKVLEIKNNSQQKKIKLEKAYSDGIIKINKEIVKIIKEICTYRGCKIVLPDSSIIYSDDSLNISIEVLEKLDQKIKLINIEF